MDRMLAAGRVAFPLAKLVEETGLSVTAARNQLLRQGKRVLRVTSRHPFYLIASPEHLAIGAPPVTWWLHDYFDWLGQPYYLALQSAAGTYGSSPQALQVTQVMTETPRRDVTVGRIRLHFFVKRRLKETPTQSPPSAQAPLRVSTLEATCYDLIRYAPRIGGIARATETILPLLPLMRPERLRDVLRIEKETATAQRLGFVLEATGADDLARVVQRCLPAKLLPVRLVPGLPGHVPETRPWRVQNNAEEMELW